MYFNKKKVLYSNIRTLLEVTDKNNFKYNLKSTVQKINFK